MDQLPFYISGFLIVLLLSSFVKIATTLSIVRFGIGLEGSPFGLVIVLLSFALSMLVIEPQLKELGGFQALLRGGLDLQVALEKRFRPFLIKHADPNLVRDLRALSQKEATAAADSKNEAEKKPGVGSDKSPPESEGSFELLLCAFLVSELRQAFSLGLLLLIPFIVLDLVVLNAIQALSITQLSHQMISLPLKILLFISVDGWRLLSEKLIAPYMGG